MPRPSSTHLGRLIACALLLCLSWAVNAQDDTELTILDKAGQIIKVYSLQDLRQRFTAVELRTITPWSPDENQTLFRGVPLWSLLVENGLSEETAIQLSALDGFATTLQTTDIKQYQPVLALERQCTDAEVLAKNCGSVEEFRQLTIEDHGPLFTVWPLEALIDDGKADRHNIWVWFVNGIQPK